MPGATASAVTAQGDFQYFVVGERIRGDWWHLFGSPALDTLVARAFAANPTIEAAQAALRAARRKVGKSPFMRELIIPFGRTGDVALFGIVDSTEVVVSALRHQLEDDYH